MGCIRGRRLFRWKCGYAMTVYYCRLEIEMYTAMVPLLKMYIDDFTWSLGFSIWTYS
jgi:hypothetical protein